MKQIRTRKRTTLSVIAKILAEQQPLTSYHLAAATDLEVTHVGQILKRMRDDGWLKPAPNPASDRSPANSSRKRYLLTSKGIREARMVLQKQGTQLGGQWQLNDGDEVPALAPLRGRRPVHAATRRFGCDPAPAAAAGQRACLAASATMREGGGKVAAAAQHDDQGAQTQC